MWASLESRNLCGLERSNSDALKRAIVPHKYYTVADNEQTHPIQNSLSSPSVSPSFFNQLEKIIDKVGKPIILTIYF